MASFSYTRLSNTGISTGEADDTVSISNTSSNPDEGLNASTLNTGGGNDSVVIVSHYEALLYSTINLGDGDDSLDARSTYPSGFDFTSSNVDAGSGNDTIRIYRPINSSVRGGSGKDTLILPGRRSAWDLEFSFGLDGILAYISAPNSNRFTEFEVFIFDDVSLDLTAPPLDSTGLSRLAGTTPQLNSSVVTPELWDGLGFNRLSLNSVANASVSCGDGDDSITINNTSSNAEEGLYDSTLSTGNGNDSVDITCYYEPLLYSSVNLGDGNDSLIAQSTYPTGYDSSASSVDAGAGDDSLQVFTPRTSSFRGGSGKDTIIFAGNRSAWDLEFIYTESGSFDHILTSNSNKLYGFEVIAFDDVSLDLTTAGRDASGLGSLSGTAPQINSTITPDLWDGLGFNRLIHHSVAQADIRTGEGNDTITISNTSSNAEEGLYDSTLNTGNGNDAVVINCYYEALLYSSINLGDGNDSLNAQSTYPTGFDSSSSSVDAGSGDDNLRVYAPRNSVFFGGPGNDTIIFSTLPNAWRIRRSKDSLGRSYVAIGDNAVYGFETIRFEQSDPSGVLMQSLSGGKDPVDPLAPWRGRPTLAGDTINEQPLTLSADAAGSQLEGSGVADQLSGNAGNDVLIGRRGADILTGRGGSDLFVLRPQDWFENDRLSDFTPKVDKLLLASLKSDGSLYNKLSTPGRAKQAVATSIDDNKALVSGAEIVYSKATGNLYYNPNGKGAGLGDGGGIIAILPAGLTLSSADILVATTLPV